MGNLMTPEKTRFEQKKTTSPEMPVTRYATILASPTAIRQPAIRKTKRFATFPATMVVQNMPTMKALCICPKTLPRLESEVMSWTSDRSAVLENDRNGTSRFDTWNGML